MDQASDGGGPIVLPNNSRMACTIVDTGFHSANVCSTEGRLSSGTNAFERNVSGKITMKLALFTTSGVRTSNPTSAITHEIEKANRSRSRKPPAASSAEVLMRQPT